MVTFRPDTSFPFLALARRCGVEYSFVLFLAGMIESGELWLTAHPLVAAVDEAVTAERRRRATIAHNAMHTGDAP